MIDIVTTSGFLLCKATGVSHSSGTLSERNELVVRCDDYREQNRKKSHSIALRLKYSSEEAKTRTYKHFKRQRQRFEKLFNTSLHQKAENEKVNRPFTKKGISDAGIEVSGMAGCPPKVPIRS